MSDWRFWVAAMAGYGGVSALLLVRAGQRPRDRMVDAWAEAHGLDLAQPERDLVAAWLRRSRWWRTVGFVLPFLLIGIGKAYWNSIHSGAFQPLPLRLGWWLVPVGYLVGVVAAETTWRHPLATPTTPASAAPPVAPGLGTPQEQAMRAAALIPRDPRDYLPAWLPRATAAVTLAVVLAGVLIALPPAGLAAGWTRSPSAAVVNAAVAVVVTGAGYLLTRWLVARRQPLTPGYRLELDDALRATSVHATAAACLAFVLLLLSRQLDQLAGVASVGVGSVFLVANLACIGAAIGCLVDLAQRHRWTVRRGIQARAGA